ncbi:vWA domain-containing protein [Haloarchaeobius salinus]|uniref:vWA domain-containing protein n=1 Tax=Haloarchaeobius salinus TaxID=1198298 RepID=UPI00210EE940|nr:vWA domain-containing protein [Haloarchaeobius salinus]
MSVEIDAELSQALPAGSGRTTLAATITPTDKQQPTKRHIAVVVDVSGSMSKDVAFVDDTSAKIELARQGVAKLLGEMHEDDKLSIIAFDSRPDVLVPMTEWGNADQDQIESTVTGTPGPGYDGALDAGGGTNIKRAIQTAAQQFTEGGDGVVSTDIVLLSDGMDRRDLDEFRQQADTLDSKGITISAGGIGRSYNEDVLLALTNRTGGSAEHLEAPRDIESFLHDKAQDARDTVAPNPQLRFEFADGFRIAPGEPAYLTEPQATSEPVSTDESTAVVDLPKLTAGERIRLTVEVLGGHKSTGMVYPMAELFVEDDAVLASTAVEVRYEDDPTKRLDIEKERLSGDVTTDIIDPAVEKATIEARIDSIEHDRGWKQLAAVLRKRLADAEATGGNIAVSKAKYDPDD